MAWEPPPNYIKLNYDVSVKHLSAAAGVVLHNSDDAFLLAATFNLGNTQVFMVEATTLHHGVRLAIQKQITNLYIDRDCLLVINALKGSWATSWQIDHIIKDITLLLRHFGSVDI